MQKHFTAFYAKIFIHLKAFWYLHVWKDIESLEIIKPDNLDYTKEKDYGYHVF